MSRRSEYISTPSIWVQYFHSYSQSYKKIYKLLRTECLYISDRLDLLMDDLHRTGMKSNNWFNKVLNNSDVSHLNMFLTWSSLCICISISLKLHPKKKKRKWPVACCWSSETGNNPKRARYYFDFGNQFELCNCSLTSYKL